MLRFGPCYTIFRLGRFELARTSTEGATVLCIYWNVRNFEHEWMFWYNGRVHWRHYKNWR